MLTGSCAGMSRVVLVTGGSRGIGLACARRFAELGDKVVTTFIKSPPPEDLFGIRCDVTSTEDVSATFATIEERFGAVEVLVSNAGFTINAKLGRMREDEFVSVVDGNLVGAFRVAQRAADAMIDAKRGRILFMGSAVGMLGSAGQTNYTASKAGLVGLARSLARELGKYNVTVNVIAPGPIATDMTEALGGEHMDAVVSKLSIARIGRPEEIAAVTAFLASEDAGFITGALIPVDGGWTMGVL
jgi:NAD(P)-dependent dehydrogenase (short-subunit alcohol dehydrogenase family)